MNNKTLAKYLTALIKKAQPTTVFTNGVIKYGNTYYKLPTPAPQSTQSTTTNFR